MTEIVSPPSAPSDWRARTLILAVVGAAAAWCVWWIMDLSVQRYDLVDPSVMARRAAMATGISVAAIAFGFGLERIRIRWTIAFALALGLVAGLIQWWNNDGHGIWNWSGASLLLAIAIALPLFQVARDEGRWSFPYTQIHGHAWTNVVLWFACWGFTAVSMLLTVLMAQLFKLIGITFLIDLLDKGWFPALVIGGAFGAALGMFRDRDAVVRLLQRVVTGVLSVLAPVLGVGLLVFLLSLPFTGLHTLWEATRSTTPILIACVIGALILINAVIGHGPEDEATSPVLRWGALALGLSILPLAIVAAIATGLRIDQYGFTPDRLWALVFVILASAYGLVYFVALVRKRQDWAMQVRPDNIRLAFATMALALLLATPLIGFNAMSANSQVARLTSGKVGVAQFDWAALGYDFGDPGRKALERLSKSSNKPVADQAALTLRSDNRWQVAYSNEQQRAADTLDQRLRILPAKVAVPQGLRDKLTQWDACGADKSGACVLLYTAGATEAVAIGRGCVTERPDFVCSPQRYVLRGGKWETAPTPGDRLPTGKPDPAAPARKAALDAGKAEIRTVPRRQVFIGDQPVGEPFE